MTDWLKTAYEVACDKLEAREAIPKMTHPLSAYWHQPDRSRVLIDDTHALMSRRTFEELLEYTGTIPTGAYEGKMWKSKFWIGERSDWLLMWYGFYPPDPNEVSINSREIILI